MALPTALSPIAQAPIKRVAVARINPAPYNPRRDLQPGEAEYVQIERSLSEFGLVQPLVWNRRTGHLVGGHQRLKVMIARGAREVDVCVVDLPPEKERALNLALNKVQGAWDQDKLARLLGELTATSALDLDLTGFGRSEIDGLLATFDRASCTLGDDSAFDAESALDTTRPAVTAPGDLIVLGRHRLLCGDSTAHDDVRRLMGDERAVLFATDPPYLVGYDGTNHPGSKASARASRNKDWSGTYAVTWDDADGQSDLYDRFVAAAVECALRPDAAWYCWHASRRQAMVEAAWQKHGAFVHCQIIWAKNRPVLTRSWYAWQHEPCFFGWRQPPNGHKPPRGEDPMRSTLWSLDTIHSGPRRPDHPTPKPVELFEIPMRQHTRPGDVCYEPFAGSGTQLIAAERLARRCLAMEISPHYCDVIVRRWINLVGVARAGSALVAKYHVGKQIRPSTVQPINTWPTPARPRAAAMR